MEDTSGFYKLFEGHLIGGGNKSVLNKNYELHRESKDQYSYPKDGWHWFDSLSDAMLFFGLDAEREDGEWIRE